MLDSACLTPPRVVQPSHAQLAIGTLDARITYGELASRARQLAATLGRFGVGSKVRVALCAGQAVERVVRSLAVLEAGGAYVLLDPEVPPERFVPDPWSEENGERLYLTGDRVRLRPDGSLELLGRIGHQIKLRGFRIDVVLHRTDRPDPSDRSDVRSVLREQLRGASPVRLGRGLPRHPTYTADSKPSPFPMILENIVSDPDRPLDELLVESSHLEIPAVLEATL